MHFRDWVVAGAISGSVMAVVLLGAVTGLITFEPSSPASNTIVVEKSPPVKEKKSVWVVPVVAPDNTSHIVKDDELLRLTNHTLDWFVRASHGRVTLTANHVTPAVVWDVPTPGADGYMDCSDVQDLAKTQPEGAPENTVVVVLLDNEWECDYGGLAQLEGNWAIVTGYNPSMGWYPQDKFVHEVGHVLGFGHAGASTCPILSETAQATDVLGCPVDPYGDWADPMGNIHSSSVPGFNPLHLNDMGWGESVLNIADPGEYTVFLPALTRVGPDYVHLPNGLDITYRAPSGKKGDVENAFAESDEYDSMEGVYLYQEGIVDTPDTVMLPFSHMRVAGHAGDHYIASDGAVSVRVDKNVQGTGAWLTVRVAGDVPEKDIWGPAVTSSVQKSTGKAFLQWRGADPSGIKEYRVSVKGITTTFAPGIRHLEVAVARGETVTATLVAVDSVGNVTTELVPVRSAD